MAETGKQSPYVEDFFSHTKNARVWAKVIGGDAAGEKRSFVPNDTLRGPSGFFSEHITRSLLDYYYSINVQIHWRRVQDSFLAVFSTLITIGKASHLHHFMKDRKMTDQNLPFTSPDGWHNECCSFFDDFYNAQWQFCAQSFDTDWMNETRLDDGHVILPIIDHECLKAGPDAYTYRIKLHPSYDRLQEKVSYL